MNKVIGEMKIKILNKEFLLRPTFRAQAEIEDRMDGLGIPAIAGKLVKATGGIKLVTAVIFGGIIGGLNQDEMPPVSFEDLGEMVRRHGFVKLIREVIPFVAACMSGEEPKKEQAPGSNAEAPLEK
jgi:hypothetical protein